MNMNNVTGNLKYCCHGKKLKNAVNMITLSGVRVIIK